MDFRFVQTIKETVPLTANEKSLIVEEWEPIPRQDEVIGRLHYFPSQDMIQFYCTYMKQKGFMLIA